MDAPKEDWRTYVLVWVIDPVTRMRHVEVKLLVDVGPTDERVTKW